MTIEKLLWKIPQYRRKKVIEVVDAGEEEIRNLPVYDVVRYDRYFLLRDTLLGDTIRPGWNDVGNYLRQDRLLKIFNKYQLAGRFMAEFPEIDDNRIIALVGNLYSDYVAGNMWADGMNPDPQAAREKLDRRIKKWAELLSEVNPSLADIFCKSATEYREIL